ncbi:Uncharacterised protein [Vibrio cholerae]|nr:Uncharacterised protein [Vibrio cholerae]
MYSERLHSWRCWRSLRVGLAKSPIDSLSPIADFFHRHSAPRLAKMAD